MADAAISAGTEKSGGRLAFLTGGDTTSLFVGIAVVLAVMMFIIPMPTVLLDTFMALNLVLSLLVLLTALYI
jgi:flagellar biosynthesis component FlhA